MRGFNYYHPTRIQGGWDRIKEIRKIVKTSGTKCLLGTIKPFGPMEVLFE